MSAWYDLPPARYAAGLRYGAERSDECAAHKMAEAKPWSDGEAKRYRQQARRLRAMATLCERSTAARAGDVDFMGLNCPRQTPESEATACAYAESLA
jgi:hypothetical protein